MLCNLCSGDHLRNVRQHVVLCLFDMGIPRVVWIIVSRADEAESIGHQNID